MGQGRFSDNWVTIDPIVTHWDGQAATNIVPTIENNNIAEAKSSSQKAESPHQELADSSCQVIESVDRTI